MEFYTQLTYPKPLFQFSYQDPILLLGSCFVENIGTRMTDLKFQTDVNPFGTLYNPASISHAIRRLIEPEPYREKDLFSANGLFHSFDHHSRFSALSVETCLDQINTRLDASACFFRRCRRLIITWGTSWVYRLKETGAIVGNCHKLPERSFVRQRLSVSDIVDDWKVLLGELLHINPELKILFTVSPIRHWKDGAHGNQLSKATLLLAIDELNQLFPEQTAYFPSYEIMMDELRDYRFYADDMLHPSTTAIEYIWERFTGSMLSPDSLSILKEWKDIQKAINHKPFQPESEAYKRFISQTLLKMERLNEKFPYFDMTNEVEMIKKKF